MHSFLKLEDGTYAIGLWLMSPQGHHTFQRMLNVQAVGYAIRLTSYLNGGKSVKIHEHLIKEY